MFSAFGMSRSSCTLAGYARSSCMGSCRVDLSCCSIAAGMDHSVFWVWGDEQRQLHFFQFRHQQCVGSYQAIGIELVAARLYAAAVRLPVL
jgi:hypothetical protein